MAVASEATKRLKQIIKAKFEQGTIYRSELPKDSKLSLEELVAELLKVGTCATPTHA